VPHHGFGHPQNTPTPALSSETEVDVLIVVVVKLFPSAQFFEQTAANHQGGASDSDDRLRLWQRAILFQINANSLVPSFTCPRNIEAKAVQNSLRARDHQSGTDNSTVRVLVSCSHELGQGVPLNRGVVIEKEVEVRLVAAFHRPSDPDIVGPGETDRLLDPNDFDSRVSPYDFWHLPLARVCSNDHFHFNIIARQETTQTGVQQATPLVVHNYCTDTLQIAPSVVRFYPKVSESFGLLGVFPSTGPHRLPAEPQPIYWRWLPIDLTG
jgi:hypothetical protein